MRDSHNPRKKYALALKKDVVFCCMCGSSASAVRRCFLVPVRTKPWRCISLSEALLGASLVPVRTKPWRCISLSEALLGKPDSTVKTSKTGAPQEQLLRLVFHSWQA